MRDTTKHQRAKRADSEQRGGGIQRAAERASDGNTDGDNDSSRYYDLVIDRRFQRALKSAFYFSREGRG